MKVDGQVTRAEGERVQWERGKQGAHAAGMGSDDTYVQQSRLGSVWTHAPLRHPSRSVRLSGERTILELSKDWIGEMNTGGSVSTQGVWGTQSRRPL